MGSFARRINLLNSSTASDRIEFHHRNCSSSQNSFVYRGWFKSCVVQSRYVNLRIHMAAGLTPRRRSHPIQNCYPDGCRRYRSEGLVTTRDDLSSRTGSKRRNLSLRSYTSQADGNWRLRHASSPIRYFTVIRRRSVHQRYQGALRYR